MIQHRKLCGIFLGGGLLLLLLAWGALGAEETSSTFQILGRVETILYGEEHTGGLLQRLQSAERDLFGRELPGSIAERQNALMNFLEKGTQGRPSFLFKLGILEWSVNQRVFPELAATRRVGALEEVVEGSSNPDGPLAMRLERMVSVLLGNDILWEEITVPGGKVLKVELQETLSPATAQKGDRVRVALHEDFALGKVLIAPRGSVVATEITEVKPPRSFGRSAEIKFAFHALYPLGPEPMSVGVGENAQQAAEMDPTAVAAAGAASVAGLVAFGPLGLAGGFFVRGDGKDIPEGSLFFLETLEEQLVHAFPVPGELRGLLGEDASDAASADQKVDEFEKLRKELEEKKEMGDK